MTIQLSHAECNLVISLLTSAIADAKEEIYKTERHDFAEELKSEKILMEKILSRLIEVSMEGERPH
jgi:hypothetical protein